jgi:threonine dehydratase
MPDPTTHDVTLADIQAGAERIAGRVLPTPMLTSRTAARVVEERQGVRLSAGRGGRPGNAEPRLFLKAEHLQVTGSFKPRGALNRVAGRTDDERRRGIITLSAGNHAQAVAWAASAVGVPVTVVMPIGASRAKVAATEGYGATVILHGEHVGEAFEEMERLRTERDLVYLPPFDDPAIIAGAGTVGLEIVEALPEVDVVVVGVGGGGLLSGIASAVRRLRPTARIYGVEPERSNALSLALAAGEVVPLQPVSIADGLGAPFAGAWTVAIARRLVESVVTVDEPTIARGVLFALERCKQLLEPAGAAALGAVLAGAIPLDEGETVCVVASGGNVDLSRLEEIRRLAG